MQQIISGYIENKENAVSFIIEEEVLRWLLTRVKHNNLKLCRGSQMYNYPMFLSTFNDQKEWVIL